MRYIFLTIILLFALTFSACSFSTDFVVVNSSGNPIEVKYKIWETGVGSLNAAGIPAITDASRLSSREWRELSPTQYAFDQQTGTVTVSLMPDVALRVTRARDWQEDSSMENFIIREVDITGAGGERKLRGDQVYKSFVAVPKSFFSFGPPASAALVYR